MGAKACLWAPGGSNSNLTPTEKCEEVEIQYPLAAARALLHARKLSERENVDRNEKVRFLFISGTLSERNQRKISVVHRSKSKGKSTCDVHRNGLPRWKVKC